MAPGRDIPGVLRYESHTSPERVDTIEEKERPPGSTQALSGVPRATTVNFVGLVSIPPARALMRIGSTNSFRKLILANFLLTTLTCSGRQEDKTGAGGQLRGTGGQQTRALQPPGAGGQ